MTMTMTMTVTTGDSQKTQETKEAQRPQSSPHQSIKPIKLIKPPYHQTIKPSNLQTLQIAVPPKCLLTQPSTPGNGGGGPGPGGMLKGLSGRPTSRNTTMNYCLTKHDSFAGTPCEMPPMQMQRCAPASLTVTAGGRNHNPMKQACLYPYQPMMQQAMPEAGTSTTMMMMMVTSRPRNQRQTQQSAGQPCHY